MSIERFFASPLVARCVLNVVIFWAVMAVACVGYAASHKDVRPSTYIDDCAMVLDRSGQQHCR